MKEITKQQKCLQLRNDVEYWLDDDEAKHMSILLNADDCPKYIQIKGDIISPSSIIGLFSPESIADQRMRKNGQWKDKKGNWHERGERICPMHTENIVPYGKSCGLC